MSEDFIEIIEVSPRDGIQNDDKILSTATKLELIRRAVVGETLSPLPPARAGLWDRGAPLDVRLTAGALSSIDRGALFSGGNVPGPVTRKLMRYDPVASKTEPAKMGPTAPASIITGFMKPWIFPRAARPKYSARIAGISGTVPPKPTPKRKMNR